MTNDEREALEWLQGLPVSNTDTKVVDHVATILLMLAARDPVAAMIARHLNRAAAIHVDEADKGISIHPSRP